MLLEENALSLLRDLTDKIQRNTVKKEEVKEGNIEFIDSFATAKDQYRVPAFCRAANQLPFSTAAPKNCFCAHAAAVPTKRQYWFSIDMLIISTHL